MKIQVHRITAQHLGIMPDAQGFFFARENLKVSISDVERIIAKFELENKADHYSGKFINFPENVEENATTKVIAGYNPNTQKATINEQST